MTEGPDNDARVVVVGGSSLLGAALRHLPGWPAQTWWTYCSGAAAGPESIQSIHIDLLDETEVERAVARIVPTHVLDVSLPAREEPAQARQAISHLCRTLHAHNPAVRYLLVSTDAVFSGEKGSLYREDDPVDPGSAYGVAKAEVEDAVRTLVPDACVARTCLLYGTDRRHGPHPDPRTADIVTALSSGRQLSFYATQYRTPTDLDELAAALQALLFSAHTGVWHLAGPDRCSRAELARETARAFGLDPGQILDQPLPERALFGKDTSLSSDKARAALGWQPSSVAQGLARLAARQQATRG